MNLVNAQSELEKVRSRWGDWTAHNIQVQENTYTIAPEVRGDEFVVNRIVRTISDMTGKPFESLRILDLGCLEGIYAVELAKQGARVVGVEIREANLEKAKIAKTLLNLNNLDFIQDDVRNLDVQKIGKFDVVLCLGLLYHLDAPDVFVFLERMKEVCSDLLILDTHISLSGNTSFNYKNVPYFGHYFHEHSKNTTQQERLKMLWSSVDNEKSFWFTTPSLCNFLVNIGFTSVFECLVPYVPNQKRDRITLTARIGKPLQYRTSDLFSKVSIPSVPEGERPISVAHGGTLKARVKKLFLRLSGFERKL